MGRGLEVGHSMSRDSPHSEFRIVPTDDPYTKLWGLGIESYGNFNTYVTDWGRGIVRKLGDDAHMRIAPKNIIFS